MNCATCERRAVQFRHDAEIPASKTTAGLPCPLSAICIRSPAGTSNDRAPETEGGRAIRPSLVRQSAKQQKGEQTGGEQKGQAGRKTILARIEVGRGEQSRDPPCEVNCGYCRAAFAAAVTRARRSVDAGLAAASPTSAVGPASRFYRLEPAAELWIASIWPRSFPTRGRELLDLSGVSGLNSGRSDLRVAIRS